MGVLPTPGQLDQPSDLAGELGFHFESVLHARHTEHARISYAAQLNRRSIVTSASTLIAANLNPKVIQARLGHATITETMDTYGHLFLMRKTWAAGLSTRSSRWL